MKKIILGMIGAMCVYTITQQGQASGLLYDALNQSTIDSHEQLLSFQTNS